MTIQLQNAWNRRESNEGCGAIHGLSSRYWQMKRQGGCQMLMGDEARSGRQKDELGGLTMLERKPPLLTALSSSSSSSSRSSGSSSTLLATSIPDGIATETFSSWASWVQTAQCHSQANGFARTPRKWFGAWPNQSWLFRLLQVHLMQVRREV